MPNNIHIESQLTCRHDAMHGHRQEEDGVAIVRAGTCTEVFLHSLYDGE